MIDYVDYVDGQPNGPTVLLVEGDASARTAAAGVIADASYRVVEAQNAAVALQLMSRGIVPDILVTGVKMVGSINGFALAHIVATRWPNIGILICSESQQVRPGDMPAGAAFLHKPYLPNSLLSRVAALVPATDRVAA